MTTPAVEAIPKPAGVQALPAKIHAGGWRLRLTAVAWFVLAAGGWRVASLPASEYDPWSRDSYPLPQDPLFGALGVLFVLGLGIGLLGLRLSAAKRGVRRGSEVAIVGLAIASLGSWHARYEYYVSPSAILVIPFGLMVLLVAMTVAGVLMLLESRLAGIGLLLCAGGLLAGFLVAYPMEAWLTKGQLAFWVLSCVGGALVGASFARHALKIQG